MKIVNYEEKFGAYSFPEGFEETLRGLTIEEQAERYRTTVFSSYSMTNWKERTYRSGYTRLEKTPEVSGLIVKDGILVGAMIVCDEGYEVPCFAEGQVCTDYSEDNNGAGYKVRICYTHLVCVTDSFGKNA